MVALTSGYIYVHTSADGLPLWSIFPLTLLGCAIAFYLLRAIAFVCSIPGERRLHRRVEAVEAAAGDTGPYRPEVVHEAATRLFGDMHTAWDAGDRARLQQLSDPALMADWAKRLDGYQANGKRQRIKVVKGPKLQYVALRADHGQVRLRVRARVRRRFEPVLAERKNPRFQFSYSFEQFWTLALRGEEWIIYSTRSTKVRTEYLTEPIVPPTTALRPAAPGAALPAS